MKRIHFLWILLLILVFPAMAQDVCPADVIRAFARAGAACTDVERNHVCYGNGTVTGVFDASNTDSFSLVGERANTGLLQQLIVSTEDEFSVASMQLQLSLINTQPGRNVSLIAFGDVTVTNQVPVRPTILVESTGLLTIRELPDSEADIIEQYPLRTTVTANGLYSEGGWLRVEVPDTSEIGWVSLDILTTVGDINTLNIVDIDSPFLRSFQFMSISTGMDDARCEGAPESGVLIQSPNVVDAVEMTINGVDLLVAGTVFLQSMPDDAMVLQQIDGQTLIRMASETRWLVSGGEVSIPLDSSLTVSGEMTETQPFVAENLVGVPVNNLNYRVRIPDAATQEVINAIIAELEAEPIVIAESSVMSGERCIRTARGTVTLYAGPGTFYEVIREVSAGARLYPVLRLSDSDGVTWWQLSNGHWMLSDRANVQGDCGEIPVTQVVEIPWYNILVLETCDTLNGPIRAGQWVQIEFTTGGWDTQSEAINAVNIDRGRITVNQQWLWVDATPPREVAEDRWYRVFYGFWYAETGTYRVTGNRLTYSVICDITVPVG